MLFGIVLQGVYSLILYSIVSEIFPRYDDIALKTIFLIWLTPTAFSFLYGVFKGVFFAFMAKVSFLLYSPIGLIGFYGIRNIEYEVIKSKILSSGDYEELGVDVNYGRGKTLRDA